MAGCLPGDRAQRGPGREWRRLSGPPLATAADGRLRLRYTADGDDVAAWPGSPIPKQTCNLSTYLVQSKGKTVKR